MLSLLALLLSLPSGFFVASRELASVSYDDSEYIAFGIDTADQLHAEGLMRWPAIVWRNQHYAKPPLFVNTVALAIVAAGRDRPYAAVAGTLVVTHFVLLLAAAFLVYPLFGFKAGFVAMLGAAGMPALAMFTPLAYPDVQLTVAVLLLVGVLSKMESKADIRWTVALGVILGLGLLAKTTFAVCAAGPVLVWIFEARRSRMLLLERIIHASGAASIGAAIASIWYVPNWSEAIAYIQSSYAFVLDPDSTVWSRLRGWALFTLRDGIGWPLGVLAVVATVAAYRVRAPLLPFRRSLVFMAAACIPMFVLAYTSPAPPTTRHLLPALTMVSAALVMLLVRAVMFHPAKTTTSVTIISGLLLTGGMVTYVHAWVAFPQLAAAPAALTPTAIMPGLAQLQPIDTTDAAIAMRLCLGAPEAGLCYLAGNDSHVNVPRLRLLAKASAAPVDFDYAVYFSWTEEAARRRLTEVRAARSPVILYDRPLSNAELVFLNRYQRLARSELQDGGYRREQLVSETEHSVALFVPPALERGDDRSVVAETGPFVNFGNRILLNARLSDSALMVTLRTIARCTVPYKMLFHVRREGSATRVLDRYISPPLTSWRPGETRTLSFALPGDFDKSRDVVVVGFFDETDAANGWPSLRALDGSPYLTVMADEGKGDR